MEHYVGIDVSLEHPTHLHQLPRRCHCGSRFCAGVMGSDGFHEIQYGAHFVDYVRDSVF